MTLKELYDKSVKDSQKWDYYGGSCFTYDMLSNSEQCRRFICQMIMKGGKDDHYLFKCIEKLDPIRFQHIVSCFLGGFIFYSGFPCIRDSIKKTLDKLLSSGKKKEKEEKNEKEIDNKRFAYIWFLICLFHDLGYAIENDGIALPEKIINSLPNRPLYIPKIYSKRNINRYKKYRECRWKVKDHGIYGGEIFFFEMCELRKKKEKENSDLYWGKKMEKIYAYAAWIIQCHNIFYIKKGDENECCYEHYKLDSFVVDSVSRHILWKKHSLLFLFCLIDTIEPIKVSGKTDILDKVKVEYNSSMITLDLSALENNDKTKYLNKINDLNNWLTDVRTNEDVVSILF